MPPGASGGSDGPGQDGFRNDRRASAGRLIYFPLAEKNLILDQNHIGSLMKLANETKIGVLAAVAIAILIIGYNFLKGNDIFSSSQQFYAVYDRVDGLTESKPIFVNGYQIGRVAKLELLPDKRIRATLEIQKELPIPANTIAEIQSTDLLGSKAIYFVLGDSIVV